MSTSHVNGSTLEDQASQELLSDRKELLDVIDELGSLGLARFVYLPQLIVCGDQSSGKSSVLEAISRVRFPTKGGDTCTLFATEVSLRKQAQFSAKVSIDRSQSRAQGLDDSDPREPLPEQISSSAELHDLIRKAKQWMTSSSSDLNRGFSDDVLRVEICGPDKPNLTLVDLPGLTGAKSKGGPENEPRMVQNLVERYMANPKSIILAILSAQNDYSNQRVLDLAEKHDPDRDRTLGIITNPDNVRKDREDMWIHHAQNEYIKLRLGYFALRNRDQNTVDRPGDEAPNLRDTEEESFFSSGPWANLHPDHRGIVALRRRLGSLLSDHTHQHLPGLINEIERAIDSRAAELHRLGEGRSSTEDKQKYLNNISRQFEKTMLQAINGSYDGLFFSKRNHQSDMDPRKLRAVIRDLGEGFVSRMHREGHLQCIIDPDPSKSPFAPADCIVLSSKDQGVHPQKKIRRTTLEKEMKEKARKSRGTELPTSVNQCLIGELFRDQSEPWKKIAQDHLMDVWKAVDLFVGLLIRHLADEPTDRHLRRKFLDPALQIMKTGLRAKLDELLFHYRRGPPIPTDDRFQEQLMIVQKRHHSLRRPGTTGQGSFGQNDTSSSVPVAEEKQNGTNFAKSAEDQYAASQIIDMMEAYYEISLQTFIDNVLILAVENCLMYPLESIFTSTHLLGLTVQDIDLIAEEKDHVQKNRGRLRFQLEKLEIGLNACDKYKRESTAKTWVEQPQELPVSSSKGQYLDSGFSSRVSTPIREKDSARKPAATENPRNSPKKSTSAVSPFAEKMSNGTFSLFGGPTPSTKNQEKPEPAPSSSKLSTKTPDVIGSSSGQGPIASSSGSGVFGSSSNSGAKNNGWSASGGLFGSGSLPPKQEKQKSFDGPGGGIFGNSASGGKRGYQLDDLGGGICEKDGTNNVIYQSLPYHRYYQNLSFEEIRLQYQEIDDLRRRLAEGAAK